MTGALTNFMPSFTDKKKVRETSPSEEKSSEADRGSEGAGGRGAGGGSIVVRTKTMNPIINSTSGSNMALISNALAAYKYISGKETYVLSLLKVISKGHQSCTI